MAITFILNIALVGTMLGDFWSIGFIRSYNGPFLYKRNTLQKSVIKKIFFFLYLSIYNIMRSLFTMCTQLTNITKTNFFCTHISWQKCTLYNIKIIVLLVLGCNCFIVAHFKLGLVGKIFILQKCLRKVRIYVWQNDWDNKCYIVWFIFVQTL